MESKVFDLIAKEQHRQDTTIELIASENFASENIMRAVGSCLTISIQRDTPLRITPATEADIMADASM